MNRNLLYVAIAALVIVSTALGYQYYREQQTSGIQIDVGNGGISVQTD
ncbi:MAG: hypothetical protein WDM84_07265 [Bauldia sp.]